MSDEQTVASAGATADDAHRIPLTRREREILGLLAEGMSGAQIASKLVLSPETVRTHVRNAMSKLGASTRSQAVVLAMQRQEIPGESAPEPAPAKASASGVSPAVVEALATMLDGLVGLYDVDGGAIYVAEEDGLSLRRATEAGFDNTGVWLPESVALGDGAPILGAGRLLGVIALTPRVSRPIGSSELLLLQAFAARVGEVLVAGGDVSRRLERAMDRFRASWSAATRVG